MSSSGMLHRVALVRTDVSEESAASIFRVEIIRELGTKLAATGTLNKSVQFSTLSSNIARDSLQFGSVC
jgi:hypothetical protein